MSTPNIKDSQGVLEVKLQTAEDDGTTTTTSDAIAFMSAEVGHNPDVTNDREMGGGMGPGRATTGALKPTIRIVTKMRTSGAVGTAPDVDPLLQIAGLVKSTLAALPSSGTTPATGGSTSTLTFDRTIGGATVWPSSSGAASGMIGMPLEIGGSLVGGAIANAPLINAIKDYQVVSNIVTITLMKNLPTAANTSTTVKRPAGFVWLPGTPDPFPCAAITRFSGPGGSGNCVQWPFSNARCGMQMAVNAGKEGRWTFPAGGKMGPSTDVSYPAVSPPITQAPLWLNGIANVNGVNVAMKDFSLDLGNSGFYSEDPNADDSIENYDNMSRDARITFSPKLALRGTRDYLNSLRTNALISVFVLLGAQSGSAPGTRWGFVFPKVQPVGVENQSDTGLARESVSGQAVGFNSEFAAWQI